MQTFPPRSNTVATTVLVCLALLPGGLVAWAAVWARSDHVTRQDRIPDQPVPFSHAHHTAEIGIDCRYCHTGVEVSPVAGVPPTETCMTCHSQLWTEAAALEPVRESFRTGERLRWTRVNALPDYVYFDHSVHVRNGVACLSSHGAVGTMPLMRQDAPLTMEWCLSCHRDPGPRLSPPEEIFRALAPAHEHPDRARAEALMARYGIDATGLTDCSVCHR